MADVTLTEDEREAHECCVKRHLCRDQHFHQRDVETIVAARVAAALGEVEARVLRPVEEDVTIINPHLWAASVVREVRGEVAP